MRWMMSVWVQARDALGHWLVSVWVQARDALERWLQVPARLTVIAALAVTTADALAIAQVSWLWELTTAGLLACTLLYLRRPKLAAVMFVLSLAWFFYCSWRLSNVHSDGLTVAADRRLLDAAGDRLSVGAAHAPRVRHDEAKVTSANGILTAVVSSVIASKSPIRPKTQTVLKVIAWRSQSHATVEPGTCVLARIPTTTQPMIEGAEISFRARVRRPRPAAFPWQFDEARYLSHLGGSLIAVPLSGISVLKQAANPQAPAESLTDEVRRHMVLAHRQALGTKLGDLLSSMVIGDKEVKPDDRLQQQFRCLGLTHIIAASGFNLTIVTLVAWWTIRFLTRCRLLINLWSFSWIVAFTLLAGFSPSVERAALMCTIVLVATSMRRSTYLPASVALAEIITLAVEPAALMDVGFQLSYAATFSIACAVERINTTLIERCRLPKWLAEALGIVWIAGATSAPIQMFYFRQIGQLSPLANLVVSPLVPAITVGGFVSSLLAAAGSTFLTSVAACLDRITGLPLSLMTWLVERLSDNNWSVLNSGAPHAGALIAYYLSFAALIAVVPGGKPKRVQPAQLAAALLAYACSAVFLFWRPPMSCTFIECGTAAVLVIPQGNALVIGDLHNPTVQRVLSCLAVRHITTAPFRDALFHRSAVWQLRGGAPTAVPSFTALF